MVYAISSQAYVAAVAYIMLAAIILVVPFDAPPEQPPPPARDEGSAFLMVTSAKKNAGGEAAPATIDGRRFASRAVLVATMAIPLLLSAFSIHCMSAGGSGASGTCATWAWVQAVMAAVWCVMFVLGVYVLSGKTAAA